MILNLHGVVNFSGESCISLNLNIAMMYNIGSHLITSYFIIKSNVSTLVISIISKIFKSNMSRVCLLLTNVYYHPVQLKSHTQVFQYVISYTSYKKQAHPNYLISSLFQSKTHPAVIIKKVVDINLGPALDPIFPSSSWSRYKYQYHYQKYNEISRNQNHHYYHWFQTEEPQYYTKTEYSS